MDYALTKDEKSVLGEMQVGKLRKGKYLVLVEKDRYGTIIKGDIGKITKTRYGSYVVTVIHNHPVLNKTKFYHKLILDNKRFNNKLQWRKATKEEKEIFDQYWVENEI